MFKPYPDGDKVARAQYVGNIRVAVNTFSPSFQAPQLGADTRPVLADDGSIVTHPVSAIVTGQVEMLDQHGALYDRVMMDPTGGLSPKVAAAVAQLIQAITDEFVAAHPDIKAEEPPRHASRAVTVETTVERENVRLRRQKEQRDRHAERVAANELRRQQERQRNRPAPPTSDPS